VLDAAAGGVDRVAHAAARVGREDVDAGLPADDLQLLHGVGALEVAGDEQRRVALRLEVLRELAGERGLAGALQAGQHDHGRGRLGEAQDAGLAAEDADELLVDDLDDLLGRVEGLADLAPAGPLLDRGDERLDDRQRDVGLEQRDADLARGGVDVGVGQPALAPQGGEDLVEPVGERVEHQASGRGRRVPSGAAGGSGGAAERSAQRSRGPRRGCGCRSRRR
jgi:hypothetical protein